MTKFHEGLQIGVQAVRNLFSSPQPGTFSARSPSKTPANTPLTSARTLFAGQGGAEDLSIQGNSAGEINSPAVLSGSTFLCGECDMQFTQQEDMTKHMLDKHDKAVVAENNNIDLDNLVQEEEECLNEAMDELDLYNALNVLALSVQEPEKAEALQDKLNRYKNIMTKKTNIQIAATEEIKRLKHEVNLSNQVATNQEKQLDKKDKEKELMAREAKLWKEKNKEKEKMINQLKEALIAKDEDEIVVVQQTVGMNKQSTGHQCNACDKSFRKSQDLERHMDAKHAEKPCSYCDKILASDEELVKHLDECIDFGIKTTICKKCEKDFTNFGLKRHKEKCQGKQGFDCPECGQMFNTAINVKTHYDSEHKWENVKSREVCKWWRKGNCTNKNCQYAHVGHQNSNGSESTSTNSARVPSCKNGTSCEWLKKGRCSYFHPRVGVQKPWVTKDRRQDSRVEVRKDSRQQSRQESRPQPRQESGQNKGLDSGQVSRQPNQLKQCKFGAKCDKGFNCGFLHLAKDFILLKTVRRN